MDVKWVPGFSSFLTVFVAVNHEGYLHFVLFQGDKNMSGISATSWIVSSPHVFMREEPLDKATVCSDLVYSEQVELLREEGPWARIRNKVDAYEGWVKKASLVSADASPTNMPVVTINRLAAHLFSQADVKQGPVVTLHFESKLHVIEEVNSRWLKVALVDGTPVYVQRGDITTESKPLSISDLPEFSKRFIGLSYTWGGRSSFGYDCSGFVQMLYRQAGILLPRDSKDQVAWQGLQPVSLSDLQPGNLLFWGGGENAIRHVGMYIGQKQFIHAAVRENMPYIHVSSLDTPEWSVGEIWSIVCARRLREK